MVFASYATIFRDICTVHIKKLRAEFDCLGLHVFSKSPQPITTSDLILKVISGFKLESKVRTVTTGCANEIGPDLEHVLVVLNGQHNAHSPKYRKLCCIGHIVHNAVRSAL